jgi:hypothetical protein
VTSIRNWYRRRLGPRRLRGDERGAIDLNTVLLGLAVFLIVGAVAAVSFTGILSAAKDTGPKANAQSVQTMVDACYAQTQDYTKCTSKEVLEAGSASGLSWGALANQVEVKAANATSYEIISTGSPVTQKFKITKVSGGTPSRTCEVAKTGGCPEGGTW